MLPGHTWLLLAVVLLLGVSGCATPNSTLGFLEDRADDLIDVIHVDFTMGEVGAVAYAGPFLLGLDMYKGSSTTLDPGKNLCDDPAKTLQIGFGGQRIIEQKGFAAGIVWPSVRWNPDRPMFTGPRPKRQPSPLAIGASCGIVLGIGAQADLYELVDFALGLFGADVAEDDNHRHAPSAAPPEPKPEPVPGK